jgi:uracil-DNA glycosylase
MKTDGPNMTSYTFPFGAPVLPVTQTDRSPRTVFVLGVYSSAVHARWVDKDGKTLISALAVASEPEIFWKGDNAAEIINAIPIAPSAGKLLPARSGLSGPSGVALDKCFLAPLSVTRKEAWLCDLLPQSRQNNRQAAALDREYRPRLKARGLPEFNFPPVPRVLCTPERAREIVDEIGSSRAEVLLTLGDEPLRWFASIFGAHKALAAYGDAPETYGRLHPIDVGGRRMQLLPLVHPRQAARLGTHSQKWAALHEQWMNDRARSLSATATRGAAQFAGRSAVQKENRDGK